MPQEDTTDRTILDNARPIDERVRDVLRRMNTAEKINQLLFYHRRFLDIDPAQELSADTIPGSLKRKLRNGLGNIFQHSSSTPPVIHARNSNVLQRYVVEHSRLGIPLLMHTESLHGLVAKDATSFPQIVGLACSWDRHLIRRIFETVALEARSRGLHVTFAPLLDIGSDPRWGRFQETFGEDPYLTAELGRETILGYQGSGPNRLDSSHVASAAKHFAGYGQADGGRNFAPARIPLRELRERILEPFRVAVQDADLAGIMPAHHEIDGVPCHGNEWLLKTLLRDTWGFGGIVVSDADDIHRLAELHHTAKNDEDATMQALRCGISLDIGGSRSYRLLPGIIEKHPSLLEHVDVAVERILALKFQLGLFDTPYVSEGRAARVNHTDTSRALSKQASDKSIVLLENREQFLPLTPEHICSIAVIGPNASTPPVGSYTSAESPELTVSVYAGMKKKAEALGIDVHFAQGCYIDVMDTQQSAIHETEMEIEDAGKQKREGLVPDDENAPLIAEAVTAARASDVAVLCVGGNIRTDREAIYAGDSRGDRDTLDLAGSQQRLIDAVAATGTPIVLVLIHGRALSVVKAVQASAAVLGCFYPGCEGGTSIADIIFGDVNPSGKLSVTIPRSVGQLPAVYNQKSTGRFRNYLYTENAPLFPFGFGLSYTTFRYDGPWIDKKATRADEPVSVSVDVTNTGSRTGDEVVQLYVRDEKASVTRPLRELKGFERVTLAAGETKTVSFTITPARDLRFCGLDYTMATEPGWFTVMVGPSSAAYVRGRFEVVE